MTITVNDTRNEYTASAGQTVFNYTFKIFADTDLNVYLTSAGTNPDDTTDLITAYTVSGVGDEDGGTITLTTPASAGDLITIVSDIPESRTTDYQTNGDFRPSVVNDDFDRVVSLVKQAVERSNRGLAFQKSAQGVSGLDLPTPEAGYFLRWNGALSGLENVPFTSQSPRNDSLTVSSLANVTDANTGDWRYVLGKSTIGDGGHGPWVLTAGDYTSELAADTLHGMYLEYSGEDGSTRAWVRQYAKIAYMSWWGLDVTDHTATINAAFAMSEYYSEIKFGDHTYTISAEIVIPPGVTVNLENCVISATHTSGNILRTEHDATGKPRFNVIGNSPTISGPGFSGTDDLVGLWIDTCNFSIFDNLVFSNFNGNSIVLGPTGARDIINIKIASVETNTGGGLKILTGVHDTVDYSNVTDGRILDCFFTTVAEDSVGVEMLANAHSGGAGSSIFGLKFDRCSFNPVDEDTGMIANIIADSDSYIYDNYFTACEGELRSSLVNPTRYYMHIENVHNCYFDIDSYIYETLGINCVNSYNNDFHNMTDASTNPALSTGFFLFDADSHDNNVYNCGFLLSQVSTDLGFTTAPMAGYAWSKLSDSGFNNRFYGQIKTDINRIFNTELLRLINSSAETINPAVNSQLSTVVDNGDTFSITNGNTNALIMYLPDSIPIGATVTFRLKYRFITSVAGLANNWRCGISLDGTPLGPKIPLSNSWTEYMVQSKITGRQWGVYTTTSFATEGPVEIEFEKIEAFVGGFPYIHNYNPVDVSNAFSEKPYGTTADRPVVTQIGFEYFDTTLGYEIHWDGTNWVNASGATV